ncbi:MAG: hypothetical protein HYX69_02060 [Planctomycetia bacterium]|nr:hypothetical protein [Planctomycetia bacterium]
MDSQPWLNRVRNELRKARLPAAYAERLVEELSDHVTDLSEEQMSMEARESPSVVERLGPPVEVAQAAAKQYRRRTFCGRHPIVMFVVLPILIMPLAWFALVMAIVGVRELSEFLDLGRLSSQQFTPTLVGAVRLLCTAAVVAPAAIVAVVLCRLASKASVRWHWPLLACAILGAIVGSTQIKVFMSPVEGQSQLTLGMGVSSKTLFIEPWHFALPVAIGLWAVWRQLQRGRPTWAS